MMYSDNIKVSSKGIVFTDKNGRVLGIGEATKKITGRIFNWSLDFKLFLLHLVSLHLPSWTVRKLVFEMAGVKIGRGSIVHMGCKFFEPGNVQIGEDSIVGDRAFLDGRDSLMIGNHVDIASEVMIYNSEHKLDDPTFKAINEPVTIKDYAFLGPRSIILPGVTVGRGSVVAAGAVVTKDVDDFSIVGGVPARKIGERKNRELNYKLGRARLFQ